jgi:hypothetical protein
MDLKKCSSAVGIYLLGIFEIEKEGYKEIKDCQKKS